jgi:septum formation protein
VLILASASPRRSELLRRVGVRFQVRTSNVDETPRPGEQPRAYAARVAADKARAAQRDADEFVLAADTIVTLEDRILGKPRDDADARNMLTALSGQTHEVITAVQILGPPGERLRTIVTAVEVAPLETRAIDAYIACGEWRGKAGAYAIQGVFAFAVRSVRGSYTNVVGLPLHEVLADLREMGAIPEFPGEFADA